MLIEDRDHTPAVMSRASIAAIRGCGEIRGAVPPQADRLPPALFSIGVRNPTGGKNRASTFTAFTAPRLVPSVRHRGPPWRCKGMPPSFKKAAPRGNPHVERKELRWIAVLRQSDEGSALGSIIRIMKGVKTRENPKPVVPRINAAKRRPPMATNQEVLNISSPCMSHTLE
jgi:hypothetical protein